MSEEETKVDAPEEVAAPVEEVAVEEVKAE